MTTAARAPARSLAAILSRASAVLTKEFVQIRRDRLTLGMIVAIPIMQLLLFGYAINTDPRHLPTLVEAGDRGPAVRAILAGLENSDYFRIVGEVSGPEEAGEALRRGEASFVVSIPPGFERALARGDRPQILLDIDAADPVAAAAAAGAFPRILDQALKPLTDGALASLTPAPPVVQAVLHRRYNPAGRTSTNIVPGLVGVILTMTMVMITSIAITREAERGTLETLLATPARPIEVMAGKIAPYVLVGFAQLALMLAAARILFDVPFTGDPFAFLALVSLFLMVNLAIGYLFSTIAQTQMQAMQMTIFFFLPSILLSGFMFPFRGMPDWAQVLGEALPLTHFTRAIRGVMLKQADFADIWREVWPLMLIFTVVASVAVARYRRTLD